VTNLNEERPVDPMIATLGTQLAEVAFRNAATTIADRVGAAKVRKDDKATIQLLEELVNELVADKAELTRIAQAYQQEVGARQISASDIAYISKNLRPLLQKLSEFSPGGAGAAEEVLNVIEPFLSVETLTIVQLMGFNVREAIGEPMTAVVRDLITKRLGASVASPPGKRQVPKR
jgi:hypothetical protein